MIVLEVRKEGTDAGFTRGTRSVSKSSVRYVFLGDDLLHPFAFTRFAFQTVILEFLLADRGISVLFQSFECADGAAITTQP